jgi:hypothetical protein
MPEDKAMYQVVSAFIRYAPLYGSMIFSDGSTKSAADPTLIPVLDQAPPIAAPALPL